MGPKRELKLLSNRSGTARAPPKICKRWLLISDHPSGNRCPMLALSTSLATHFRTTIKFSTPPPCSVPSPQDTTRTTVKSVSTLTSPWLEETLRFLLWKWPSGLTPTPEAFKTLTSLPGVSGYTFDLVRGEKTLGLIKSSFRSGRGDGGPLILHRFSSCS
ncbi:putative 5-methyltetrahydropteroyltriglutamate--homocysteine S-methyltransferase [Helianthus annuus]|uniref:5-methyltetrahydropteroyltriglutamate--homocysteine S-methyltransferase n=1 Tax=Helianthus annuus TaxID=4232 RepID=A0A9K3H2H5_HELAN|nr:putative 5-methyltetrahydropteroyltriglutamate--homocysteine S-methyltransferase [Helianthus annuus]KAF5819830.1 putative 5-methyltetrahydropteroyltriglutamate--homocysteine S-methyltransferase [Helianthus annuus]KAJ0941317.1 putative 5-methyltetrahydropteroyltriglutamate--homocysteine S-methyltransferase [Helianthus annuus]